MARGVLRRRRLALLAAVCCIGLLPLWGVSSSARARHRSLATASAARCPSNGGVISGLFFFGGGGKLLSETDLPVCVTGRLAVTFAGDPAARCAVYGLCGYAGTETWQPQNAGDMAILTVEWHGRRSTTATMIIGGPGNPLLSAVQRSHGTGTTTACSDRSQSGDGFFSLPVNGGQVTIGLRGADTPLFGTRCAGPVGADFLAALPSRTLHLNQLLHGSAAIDLTGSGAFAAHGLAGTVRSTIVLALGRPYRSSGSSSSTPPPGAPRSRLADVNYRVTDVAGGATVTVRSSTVAAECGPFDACGLRGVISVVPGTTSGGTVDFFASARLRRPKRDLLAALGVARRGNPAGISVNGTGDASLRGVVTADLTQENACRDQVALRQVSIEVHQRHDRMELSVSSAGSQADPLRTRCPGPELGSHQLASAWMPLTVLHKHSFTVTVHGGSFSDGPYRVRTRSTLTITLRRMNVTTQILPFLRRTG